MLTKNDLDVKYILFSHFARDDFKTWSTPGATTNVASLSSFKFLTMHFRELARLLNATANEGIMILFFSPGYDHFLEGMAVGKTVRNIERTSPQLQYARAMKDAVMAEANQYDQLARRLRFIIAQDLEPLFARWQKSGSLRRWFIGRTEALRYDSPKMIEAIIRIRHIGSGIPIFRFDYDAIFRGNDLKHGNAYRSHLDLGLVCTQLREAHQLRLDHPQISTFLCSAQYDTSGVENPPLSKTEIFESWMGAFATRVHPAIPVDIKKAKNARRQELNPPPGIIDPWFDYGVDCFDVKVARKFYGFTPQGRPTTTQPQGMAKLGAHPLVSVISGAGLNISDSGIMDLPPFSGLRLNVSFIDDHHKYCLHRELRHFTTVWIPHAPLLSDAKIDTIRIQKLRGPLKNLPEYVLGNYLPTLLWGCVMDSWINYDPLLKFRRSMLASDCKLLSTWDNLPRTGRSRGCLPAALHDALEQGSLTHHHQDRLAKELEAKAIERINEVRETWKGLVTKGKQETFASTWAKGHTEILFPQKDYFTPRQLSNPEERETARNLARGIAPNLPDNQEIKHWSQLNPHLYIQLRDLIEDTIDYVEWTLNWPAVVQVIRSSVEPGALATDTTWSP